jgi:hypothetical protein
MAGSRCLLFKPPFSLPPPLPATTALPRSILSIYHYYYPAAAGQHTIHTL